MIVMTVLLEAFLTSYSVNKAPCFVWHALSEVTLNLRGTRLWKTDIFSKDVIFSCHLKGVSKQLCLLSLSDRMTLLLVQWEVNATAEGTSAVCIDLCSCWGLRRGFIRQKVKQCIFILGLYPPALHHSHLQFWGRDVIANSSCSGDHLTGGADRIYAWNGADRHLGRGRHELQRETLLPSYSPLKLIPSKWNGWNV